MPQWDDLRIFLAVVRNGSVSAAARDLDLTTPTVRRRIDELEARLDAKLFERLSCGYRATEVGLAVAERAKAMASLAGAIDVEARGARGRVEGQVVITTSEGIGVSWLAPRLSGLLSRHPGLDVKLLIGVARADLGRGEAEIALRLGEPGDVELVGRRVAWVNFGLYGSADYLARRDEPRGLEDLPEHDVIENAGALRNVPQARALRACLGDARPRIALDSVLAQREAVRAGLGIAALPTYLADGVPDLQRILTDLFDVEMPVWILMRRDLHACARVSAVRDYIVEAASRTLPPRPRCAQRTSGMPSASSRSQPKPLDHGDDARCLVRDLGGVS
jgi:DNA-binding transcriptional LysR family regulator